MRPWSSTTTAPTMSSHEQPPVRMFQGAVSQAAQVPPDIPLSDLRDFLSGQHHRAHRMLGAHLARVGAADGVLFSVWAPGAEAASVVGDFNGWKPAVQPMRRCQDSGVWESFVPGLLAGARYRFALRTRGGPWTERPDPFARELAAPGAGIAVVRDDRPHAWQDDEWMNARGNRDWLREPIAIFEAGPGAWGRAADGRPLGYRALADRLVPQAAGLGFTHIELAGVACSEHGGRPTADAPFTPSPRFGTPEDFRSFVDRCHGHGIGVLVDWPAAYVGRDLTRFDGNALFERAPAGTQGAESRSAAAFDYGRPAVRSLLLSSALFWLQEMHLDGLRLPALASALYLDYERGEGAWTPNKYGGSENLDAIQFLRELTEMVRTEAPGTLMVAEEPTGWPQLTRPPWLGGLGFTLRWSSGWMHDTLEYFAKDPVYRHYHHDMLTLSPMHTFGESYVLPLGGEEMTGPQGALWNRMPGDTWQRLANVRLLYTYLWTFPGKKLLFMGGAPGQAGSWLMPTGPANGRVADPDPEGLRALVRDLNRLYRDSPPLHRQELSQRGFEWIDRHDAPQSIIAYLRRDGDSVMVVALNFTPVPRHPYRIGVPFPGVYHEVLNSDSAYYRGSNLGNMGDLRAEAVPWMGRPYSVNIVLPPLGGVVLKPAGDEAPRQ